MHTLWYFVQLFEIFMWTLHDGSVVIVILEKNACLLKKIQLYQGIFSILLTNIVVPTAPGPHIPSQTEPVQSSYESQDSLDTMSKDSLPLMMSSYGGESLQDVWQILDDGRSPTFMRSPTPQPLMYYGESGLLHRFYTWKSSDRHFLQMWIPLEIVPSQIRNEQLWIVELQCMIKLVAYPTCFWLLFSYVSSHANLCKDFLFKQKTMVSFFFNNIDGVKITIIIVILISF